MSTFSFSPVVMNSGTWISAPVSSVAGLVPPVERPAGGVLLDQLVDPGTLLDGALDQPDGVVGHRRVAVGDAVAQHDERVAAAQVGLVEDVDRALARLGASAHEVS